MHSRTDPACAQYHGMPPRRMWRWWKRRGWGKECHTCRYVPEPPHVEGSGVFTTGQIEADKRWRTDAPCADDGNTYELPPPVTGPPPMPGASTPNDIQHTVLHIQPDDVLLIGNVGLITHEAADRMIKRMTETIDVKKVYLFEGDINVQVLRDQLVEG